MEFLFSKMATLRITWRKQNEEYGRPQQQVAPSRWSHVTAAGAARGRLPPVF